MPVFAVKNTFTTLGFTDCQLDLPRTATNITFYDVIILTVLLVYFRSGIWTSIFTRVIAAD